MTEREKKDMGLWYDANYNSDLLMERDYAEELCFEINRTSPRDGQRIREYLKKLLAELALTALSFLRLMWITDITAISETIHLSITMPTLWIVP